MAVGLSEHPHTPISPSHQSFFLLVNSPASRIFQHEPKLISERQTGQACATTYQDSSNTMFEYFEVDC